MAFDADVIVVGAGPVGLAAAVELAGRGRSVRVIEQAGRIGRQPRAKTTNVRTMEHMRRWGLAGAVRDASPLSADYPNRVVFGTGMFGRVISDFTNCFNADRTVDPRYAEAAQWIPQYEVERLLRDHAAGLAGCRIDFNTSLVGLNQDEGSVTVTLSDGSMLHARYLIGADGAHSKVREVLGIAMQGDERIAKSLTLVLRIPGFAERQKLGQALMYWLIDPLLPAVMGPMDRDDVWFWGSPVSPDARLDAAEIAALVARSLGQDVAFEVLMSDFWIARRLQADSYGQGRVWLAGDACHLHPPFGGHGMNLGIADAVDLGWKIAATLDGWGGPGLVPSYETERRPVHKAVITEAVENMVALGQHFAHPMVTVDGAEGEAARTAADAAIQAAKDREFHSLGLVLGYGYCSGLIAETAHRSVLPVGNDMTRVLPGCRTPHAWLANGQSLFDLFGPDFTLLQLTPGNPSALLTALASIGMPVHHVVVDDAGVAELYTKRFVLIRPDQHVAWCGDEAEELPYPLDRLVGRF